MQSSLSIYYRQSPGLLLKAWMAEHLHNFAHRVIEWLIGDIINDFESRKSFFAGELDKANDLSAIEAKARLINLNRTIQLLGKLDKSISHIPNKNLNNSFESLKKTVYKLEARLHRISVSENPILETPEDMKVKVSSLGLNSLKQSLQ